MRCDSIGRHGEYRRNLSFANGCSPLMEKPGNHRLNDPFPLQIGVCNYLNLLYLGYFDGALGGVRLYARTHSETVVHAYCCGRWGWVRRQWWGPARSRGLLPLGSTFSKGVQCPVIIYVRRCKPGKRRPLRDRHGPCVRCDARNPRAHWAIRN